MASIWKLPVIFLCENNQYAMSMPAYRGISVQAIADRAVAYNMPGETVEGMNPLDVYQAVKRAVARARAGDGPTLVEAMTYRYTGHSRSDKQVYRTKEEVQEWKEHDPIPNFQNWLINQGYLSQEEADQIVARVEADIADSISFAEASEEPQVENLLRDVYTEEPECSASARTTRCCSSPATARSYAATRTSTKRWRSRCARPARRSSRPA
jgi:TPP-dependent pyruvate/acetoin dehydrogenase alpha subunit